MNSIDKIKKELFGFLNNQFQVEAQVFDRVDFTLNVDDKKQSFGDISSNAAMILAKQCARPPREIAQEVVDNFKSNSVEKIEIAGPGFINLYLTKNAYQNLLLELATQKKYFFKADNLDVQNYSVEYVSANPTGPLHFGHGRGGIIGDVLGNILKFVGHKVTKEFYINDAGNQINTLGQTLLARCKQELGQNAELPENGYHGEYMIETAKECIAEHGTNVIDQPNEFFANYAKEKMLLVLKNTLNSYGVEFDVWFSEKSLHTSGAVEKAIQILKDGGYIFEADNATWFRSTAFGDDKDRVLKKSNGDYTYAASDLAYMQNKVDRGFNNLVMALGQDHHSYAVRVEGFRQALGLNTTKLDTILFQLVNLVASGEAVKMSKRSGKFVTLQDIIDTVGKDVARFFFLNRKADSHLDFNLDLALKKTEENPVFYIQYAYVRIKGILRKAANINEFKDISNDNAQFVDNSEYQIIKKIIYLKELLLNISKNNQTHQLSYYALELSRKFHSYYTNNKVLDLENIKRSKMRLLLLKQLEETLGLVLELLGLESPDTM